MDQARAEVKGAKIILRKTSRHAAWPSICRLQNGDILVVFSGDRDWHVCPYGKVMMMRSKDEGETWSEPKVIANSIIDDRDAGILQLPDGEVIVTWFTSLVFSGGARRQFEKMPKDLVKEQTGCFLIRSKDNGETWSEPEKLINYAQSPHGPIVLKDGSLLQVGRWSPTEPFAASYNTFDKTDIAVSRSTDRGRTWKVLCKEIPVKPSDATPPTLFHEPHVAELADGTLIAMARFHGQAGGGTRGAPGHGYMRQSFSKDGGTTWSPFEPSPLLGLPPHFLTLPDGKLICTYGRRVSASDRWNPAHGIYACISDDGGKTWDVANEIQLLPSVPQFDLGYPASCRLSNGDILTVYYYKPNQKMQIKGERTWIMTTRWRVK